MKPHNIDPAALYWASFNRFELRIPGEAVIDLTRSGPADDAAAYWAPKVRAQIDADGFTLRPTPDAIRAELKEYGAWDADALADDDANMRRLVWVAAGNIADSDAPDCSEPVRS